MNGLRLKITKENSVSIMAEVENEVLTRYKLDVSDYTAKIEAVKSGTVEANTAMIDGQKKLQATISGTAKSLETSAQSTQAYAAQMEKAAKAEADFYKQLNLVLKSTSDAGKSMKQLKDEVALVNKALESAQTGSKNFQELSKRSQELEGALKKAKDEAKGLVEQAPTLRQQYKDALKDVQNGVEGATERAAALKDQLDDANEAVGELASGSKFEQFSNSLGAVGGKLANLDFEGAAEKSQQLADVASKITFGEAIKGVKDFGSSLLNVGKAILGNPLFLVAGAVAGITAAIYQWITSESELEKQIRLGREALEERARVDQKEYDIAVTLAKARGASEAELSKLSDDNLKKTIERTKEKLRLDTLEVQSKIDAQKIIEGVFGKDAASRLSFSKEIIEAEKALQTTRDEIDKLDANLRASRIKGVFDITAAVITGADKRREAIVKEHDTNVKVAADQKKLDEDRKKRLEEERKAEAAHEAELIRLGEERNKELEKQQNERLEGVVEEQEAKAELDDTAYEREKELNKQKKEDAEADAEFQKNLRLESARVGLNALVSIFDTAAQLDGEGSAFAKVAAIFRIGIDTAKAISSTIAGAAAAAAAAGPAAPFVLGGYIASGIATVFGAYAQVKALLDKQPPKPPKANVQRFAEGTSLVTGGVPNTDSVDALLMPGERVVKKSDNMNYWDALEDISRGTFNQNYMHVSDIVPMLGAAVSESRSLEGETQSIRIAQGLLGLGKWKGENIAKALKQMDKNESVRTKKTIKAITETKKVSLRKQ